ncbi:MAG: hypothetical protein IJ646_01665 [Clostridia bacterium]|nr:hypothetical protein [Clostridia bacterium]
MALFLIVALFASQISFAWAEEAGPGDSPAPEVSASAPSESSGGSSESSGSPSEPSGGASGSSASSESSDSSGSSEPSQDAPAETFDAPAVVEDVPAVVEEAPVVVEDAPAVVEEEPVVVEEEPVIDEEEPAIVEEEVIEEEIVEEEVIEEEIQEIERETAPMTAASVIQQAASVVNAVAQTVSALQQMITDALSQRETLSGQLTLTVGTNMGYAGDLNIAPHVNNKVVADDFELVLTTEDAGDDGLSGDGSTTVEGDVVISQFKVRLQGLVMGLNKKITVKDGGALDFRGTAKDDAVAVINAGGTVDIRTGDGKDEVTVAGGGATTVDTGADNDTVNATLQGGAASIATGAGDDAVSVTSSSTALTVDTGDGDDTVDAVLLPSGAEGDFATTIDTGAGSDAVDVDARSGADGVPGSVRVDTGAGDDTVTVHDGALEHDPDVATQLPLGGQPTHDMTIATGDGHDLVNIDASASGAFDAIDIDGGADADRVHFTGILNGKADAPISGNRSELALAGEDGHTLNVKMTGVGTLSDELVGKTTVYLYPQGVGSFTFDADEDFVNYVLKSPVSGLSLTAKAASKRLLTSVVIDAGETLDEDKHISLNDVDARGLNLVVRGKTVDVNGTVRADNALIHASDLGQQDEDAGFFSNLFNVSAKAAVTVARGAAIEAENDVELTAKTRLEGGMLSILKNFNIINVKVAEAAVDVDGSVRAGAFRAEAKNEVKVGYKVRDDVNVNELSPEALMDYGQDEAVDPWPLDINVVSAQARTRIAEGAVVSADGGSARLVAENAVKASGSAKGGTVGLPVALAVNVLTGTALARVDGAVTATGTDVVTTAARSGMDADAYQAGSYDDTIAAGLNFLKLAWSNIKGKIKGDAARKQLDAAVAKAGASDYKITADEQAADHGKPDIQTVEQNGVVTVRVDVAADDGYQTAAVRYRYLQPGADHYTYGIAYRVDGTTDGWSFKLPGEQVDVYVDYVEADVQPSPAPSAAPSPAPSATPRDDQNPFGNRAVDPQALIQDAVGGAAADADDEGNPVDLIQQMFDATPEPTATPVPAKVSLAFRLEEKQAKRGAILTSEEDPNREGHSLSAAAAGDEIAFFANPAYDEDGKTRFALQEGSLTVTYTVEENGATIQRTETLAQAKAGMEEAKADDSERTHYVPAAGYEYGVRLAATQNGAVTYDPDQVGTYIYTFTATPDAGYAVGKAYVSYAKHNDDGVLSYRRYELTPDADGRLKINFTDYAAEAGTIVDVQFTFVDPADPGSTAVHSQAAAQYLVGWPVRVGYNQLVPADDPHSHRDIGAAGFDGYENGRFYFSFDPDASTGYTLNTKTTRNADGVEQSDPTAIYASYVDGKGIVRSIPLSKDADGWYVDPVASKIPQGRQITVYAVFTEDLHEVKGEKEPVHGTSAVKTPSVKVGDTVKVSVSPEAGYGVSRVAVDYYVPGIAGQAKRESLELTLNAQTGLYEGKVTSELSPGTELQLSVAYAAKDIGLIAKGNLDGEAAEDNVVLREALATVGETVVVAPNAELTKKGYKVAYLSVEYAGDNKGKLVVEGDTFIVPADAQPEDIQKLNITAELALKRIAVPEHTALENGGVDVGVARVDPGDRVSVTVAPAEGYRLKTGTLKAVVTSGGTSYVVVAEREASGVYAFTVPADIDADNAAITFKGVFMPGHSDGKVETSIGAGAARCRWWPPPTPSSARWPTPAASWRPRSWAWARASPWPWTAPTPWRR